MRAHTWKLDGVLPVNLLIFWTGLVYGLFDWLVD